MPFKIISFYTIDTPYEQEIKGLKETLTRFNLNHLIKGFPSRNSWVENCAIKPEFIFEALQNCTEDILYLDSDARVFSDLQYFHTVTADFAVHYRKGYELLSGTLFFKNNEKAKKLVENWVSAQKNNPNKWDQKVLAECLKSYPIDTLNLPLEYCQIFDNLPKSENPQIVHYQASRKYKLRINEPKRKENKMSQINSPDRVYGMRTRHHPDGTFSIVRQNKEVEKYLDQNFHRIKGSLRWAPKAEPSQDWSELEHLFKGKTCYIIGKGPSLDDLTAEDFEDKEAPIFCINETVLIVENFDIPNTVFGIQQDTNLTDKCKPKKSHIFISESCQHWYSNFDKKYIYNSHSLGISHHRLTAVAAIVIAKNFGCKNFDLLCFDACVNNKTEYADVIGYSPAKVGNPNRFLKHKSFIMSVSQGCNINFKLPTKKHVQAGSNKP